MARAVFGLQRNRAGHAGRLCQEVVCTASDIDGTGWVMLSEEADPAEAHVEFLSVMPLNTHAVWQVDALIDSVLRLSRGRLAVNPSDRGDRAPRRWVSV